MIKCVIVDDEPLAVDLLASYVERHDKLELLRTFTNPILALEFLAENKANLLLTDIQMPEMNGLILSKVLGDKIPIIFTTAYTDYAAQGFDLKAIDYLVKPITEKRFGQAIRRVEEYFPQSELIDDLLSEKEYIFVKTEYRLQKILLKDILFFKGFGDYLAIHTSQGKILTLEKMKEFEKSIPQSKFVRVHKSYLVSIEKINFIERNRITIEKEIIPIGATYQKNFLKIIGR